MGKTSLGKSIARALGRKFVRLSLGGVHDEAEIRGHRRTYIGALPGQIMQGIRRAETNDPVFMLDEIDKVGRDFRGDPGSALLEALDPEQNFSFRDNYLDVPFDLSKVLFITTANMLDPVAEPLRDRMEIIELQGYTEEEKVHIAFQYLIPRQIEENGISGEQIEFPEETHPLHHSPLHAGSGRAQPGADHRHHLPQAGAPHRRRQDRQADGDAGTGAAARHARRHEDPHRRRDCRAHQACRRCRGPGVDADRRRRALRRSQQDEGQGRLHHDRTARPGDAGVHAGRADLGAVECEGARASTRSFFADHDIHIHVPAGAIPKDGPSAGVTMVTALVSLLTDRPVRPLTAMTGEITLSGNVLPIGGIKEKTLAAKRAGVTDIILPAENRQNVRRRPDAGAAAGH